MNILLLGYGKMGQEIEKIAIGRGHHITARITIDNKDTLTKSHWDDTDVVIEFSAPEAAFSNIQMALENKKPVVSGTTGWLHKKADVEKLVSLYNGSFFYASNFSIGVNIFFRINRYLAQIMDNYSSYDVSLKEIHHTAKKDAPSGTAITLAEDVIRELNRKTGWEQEPQDKEKICITSERTDDVPGTHFVTYENDVDTIEIKHEAKSRKGFALGAVMVAEWIQDKKGVLSMDDFLSF
jgi:4-hydroxy-tetrahydrodipicolinate reductase